MGLSNEWIWFINDYFILRENKKYLVTKEIEKADILILNTCSIREKAQEKVFHQLGRWKKLKNKKPNMIIAVGGCVATQEGKEIFKRANYVDIVFGTQTLHKLPEMISKIEKNINLLLILVSPIRKI